MILGFPRVPQKRSGQVRAGVLPRLTLSLALRRAGFGLRHPRGLLLGGHCNNLAVCTPCADEPSAFVIVNRPGRATSVVVASIRTGLVFLLVAVHGHVVH